VPSAASSVRPTAAGQPPGDPVIELPLTEGSLRIAVMGDSGTGGSAQYQLAVTMARFQERFPFMSVLMMGDNLYGSEDAEDYESKFERPYKELLDRGVKFYASLGNHDEPSQRHYRNFNMGGRAYYSFKLGEQDARFFALDSNYMDKEQLEWLRDELSKSEERWKICFFHHPIYSSGGRHGPDLALREYVEPLFLEYGVDVVFTGHEHFYERIKPQHGIVYFVSGGAGKLRKGDIRETPVTAKGFDRDYHFVLLEIVGDQMYFQTVSRTGATVDSGTIPDRVTSATEDSPRD
jgi:3',5'-cyclic AMP phosphodiesterase CpdA